MCGSESCLLSSEHTPAKIAQCRPTCHPATVVPARRAHWRRERCNGMQPARWPGRCREPTCLCKQWTEWRLSEISTPHSAVLKCDRNCAPGELMLPPTPTFIATSTTATTPAAPAPATIIATHFPPHPRRQQPQPHQAHPRHRNGRAVLAGGTGRASHASTPMHGQLSASPHRVQGRCVPQR